jgi:hypothetical protein
MKRIIYSLGLCFTLITSSFAADYSIDQLNAQIDSLFSPFLNEVTVAKVTVGTLETNDEHAVKVDLNGFYRKSSSKNMVEVKIGNLSYDYGDGSAPKTVFNGLINFSLSKWLPLAQVNNIFEGALPYVDAAVKDWFLSGYGDAASMRSIVTSTTKDTQGNYSALSALISIKLDLAKLPADQLIEDIIVTEAVFSFTLNANTGLIADAFLVTNPAYKRFNKNEMGLKELLDGLIAGNEFEMAVITAFIKDFDWLADIVVGNKLSKMIPKL